MKWNEFLGDYFTFSRRERIALLAVILVIVGIWIFPKVSRPARPKTVSPDTNWIAAAKQLMISTEDSPDQQNSTKNVSDLVYNKPLPAASNKSKAELFYFDPNILSFEGWTRLGLREKTIATIQNYVQKGGHFYKAEDLKKIYGIHADEYARLEPYIRISTANFAQPEPDKKTGPKKEFSNEPQYPRVDINTADTSAFAALPAIGNKLAARIVSFRDKLGGFYSVDQIGETYGLPDSGFQKIKPFLNLGTTTIKKININTATKDEMKSHPYLKWNVANAIVEYRNQHGIFSSLEDLKKIALITNEVFEKIKFYLTL